MLSAAEHSRLVRVLELTLSDVDGEALAAARAARRLLAGRRFSDVWPVPAEERPTDRRTASGLGPRWRRQATECLRRPDLLAPWEYLFLRSVLQRPGNTLSPKQTDKLEQIAEKIEHAQGMSF